MRKIALFVLLIVVQFCSVAHASRQEDRRGGDELPSTQGGGSGANEAFCELCRDLDVFPMDAVAYAYNGFFGDNPCLLDADLHFPFVIEAPDGSSVLVWFEGVLFDVPTMLPNLMDVLVRMTDGRVLRFTLLQDGPDIPIGWPYEPPAGAGTGSEGDDDYEEPDEVDEVEIYDNCVGVVDIVDPDDEGEFPDWEEDV